MIHKKKNIVFVTILLLLTYTSHLKKTSIYLVQLTEDALFEYFRKHNITTDFLSKGIKDSLVEIYPKDSIFKAQILNKEIEYSNVFEMQEGNTFSSFQMAFLDLYNLIPEPFQNKEYRDIYYQLPWAIQKKLIQKGWFAPLCDGVSKIGNSYFERLFPNVVSAELFHISLLDHVVSEITFYIDDEMYKMVFDFQNGFYGPIDNHTSLPIPLIKLRKIVATNDFDDLGLYFLPEELIRKKKNWIPQHFALNIFPDSTSTYHQSSIGSKYPAYRQTYPPNYYVWFYKGHTNIDSIKEEICRVLVQ